MSFLVAHGKEVVSGGVKSHCVVPWAARVRGPDGHHSAKYIGIVSNQVIGADSCQRARLLLEIWMPLLQVNQQPCAIPIPARPPPLRNTKRV
jgi:hypothetical protein